MGCKVLTSMVVSALMFAKQHRYSTKNPSIGGTFVSILKTTFRGMWVYGGFLADLSIPYTTTSAKLELEWVALCDGFTTRPILFGGVASGPGNGELYPKGSQRRQLCSICRLANSFASSPTGRFCAL